MKTFVAIYEHRFGVDTCVFQSEKDYAELLKLKRMDGTLFAECIGFNDFEPDRETLEIEEVGPEIFLFNYKHFVAKHAKKRLAETE